MHGPRPLARSALFSPNLALAVHVKYAPFASRVRRGYLRDQHERDLAIHLDTAIRGIILSDRWPKSGIELFVTILESQADAVPFNGSDDGSPAAPWGTMTTLAGCITAASAALVDAGIDCIETVSGGVAALVVDRDGGGNGNGNGVTQRLVLDPNPEEHLQVQAACVVGYLTARDEITEIWLQGDTGDATDQLIDAAVAAAKASATVLTAALLDTLAAGADSGVPHSV